MYGIMGPDTHVIIVVVYTRIVRMEMTTGLSSCIYFPRDRVAGRPVYLCLVNPLLRNESSWYRSNSRFSESIYQSSRQVEKYRTLTTL